MCDVSKDSSVCGADAVLVSDLYLSVSSEAPAASEEAVDLSVC